MRKKAPKPDEPPVEAPPFVQAIRAIDYLWLARNALRKVGNQHAVKRAITDCELAMAKMNAVLAVVLKQSYSEDPR